MKMQSLSSPSLNSYSSSNKLTQIAARVVNEFQSVDNNTDEFANENQQEADEEDEGEFEFALAPQLSPIPADEIFSNGQIRPVYPLFNTELVFGKVFPNTNSVTLPKTELVFENISNTNSVTISKTSSRLPLGKLFMEERNNCSSSCSSSESDELDGVPAETYCVWTPADNKMRKKSSSTGTSKRWKFRDLLHKSNSDGKDTFDFLTPKKEFEAAGKETAAPPPQMKKGPVKENDVRRSYLPYKKDLVELFFNVNGVSRHVNPY